MKRIQEGVYDFPEKVWTASFRLPIEALFRVFTADFFLSHIQPTFLRK